MRNNERVKKWTKKIKRKKAISLQQNLAVIMSSTDAVVLSEHTAVTARTCRIADLKVAADIKCF
jgi:tRNA1(Val) A37 N6-methylase TrmN6